MKNKSIYFSAYSLNHKTAWLSGIALLALLLISISNPSAWAKEDFGAKIREIEKEIIQLKNDVNIIEGVIEEQNTAQMAIEKLSQVARGAYEQAKRDDERSEDKEDTVLLIRSDNNAWSVTAGDGDIN